MGLVASPQLLIALLLATTASPFQLTSLQRSLTQRRIWRWEESWPNRRVWLASSSEEAPTTRVDPISPEYQDDYQERTKLTDEAIEDGREIRAIAGPALLGTLLDPFLSVVDTAWVSRLGTVSLGAVAASSEIFTLTIAVSLALRESASSTIARLLAAGKTDEAEAYGAKTLQLAVVGGLVLAYAIAGPKASQCVGLMGAPPGSPLHTDALAYSRTRALALPASLALFASEGICRGFGDTLPPLKAAILAGTLNTVLDPLFMFGPLRWGVTGAAAATALSQVCACLFLLREVQKKRMDMKLAGTGGGNHSTGKDDKADELDSTATTTNNNNAKSSASQLGTSAALLLRSTSQLGCWVFIASEVSRKLGPVAIAAHGVVLKVWLLFVLAAEAPAIAGQVICARHVSTGQMARARTVLLRLLRRTAATGVATAAALVLAAGPVSSAFFPADPGAAAGTKRLFQWAAICVPLVWPNALFESTLLGAGNSYKYIAISTFANCLAIMSFTKWLIWSRPLVSSAWWGITAFFILRMSCSGGRIFATQRGGLGFDRRGFACEG